MAYSLVCCLDRRETRVSSDGSSKIREGRTATREEVIASIESGLPNLEALAGTQRGGAQALHEAKERFWKYLPAEANTPNPKHEQ
jgi:hypothetical protein